jgi:hypothetical protein
MQHSTRVTQISVPAIKCAIYHEPEIINKGPEINREPVLVFDTGTKKMQGCSAIPLSLLLKDQMPFLYFKVTNRFVGKELPVQTLCFPCFL